MNKEYDIADQFTKYDIADQFTKYDIADQFTKLLFLVTMIK